MNCPVCRKSMIIIEYSNIEIDYCTICGGIWFDRGELDLMMQAVGIDEHRTHWKESIHKLKIPLNPPLLKGERGGLYRRCPLCRKKMTKRIIGKKPEVLIDCCIKEDGLWFDGGELQQVIEQFSDSGEEKTHALISFIRSLFKKEE